MFSIIVTDAEDKETFRTLLKPGRVVTIGRGADQIIRLGAVIVSRKHGRIELRNGKPTYFDEESANGSRINGDHVRGPTPLGDKTVLEIGGYKIKVQAEAGAAPAEPPKEDPRAATMIGGADLAAPSPPTRIVPAQPPPKPKAEEIADLELQPIAPPAAPSRPAAGPPVPPPKPAVKLQSPLEGMSFIDIPESSRDQRRSVTDTKSTDPLDAATALLDKHVQGIRNFREQAVKEGENRREYVNQEWEKILVALRQLTAKLGRDPRVQQFTISRDNKEVTVKLTDTGEKRGYRYLLLSRDHPEGKFPDSELIWLREFGRDDSKFKEPKDALADLVQRIAGTLA